MPNDVRNQTIATDGCIVGCLAVHRAGDRDRAVPEQIGDGLDAYAGTAPFLLVRPGPVPAANRKARDCSSSWLLEVQ